MEFTQVYFISHRENQINVSNLQRIPSKSKQTVQATFFFSVCWFWLCWFQIILVLKVIEHGRHSKTCLVWPSAHFELLPPKFSLDFDLLFSSYFSSGFSVWFAQMAFMIWNMIQVHMIRINLPEAIIIVVDLFIDIFHIELAAEHSRTHS